MAERFRFFDSIDGEDEREYTADEFAEYFRQFIRNGIFTGGENLQVSTDEKDMKVFIKPGYAFIEGYLYKIDTEPLVIQHNIADPSLNRIDRIVIRLDRTLENRYVKAFILEGTPAEIPQVPELTRNNNIYEISLAQVEIIAGKSFIESYQITDERLNNDVCGIATHLFEQVDTTDIFNEWQNYLGFKKNESNLSYSAFVAELQSKLSTFQQTWDDWIEDKISEPAGEFYAEWKAWFNELQDTTNLVTKSQFDGFKENYENSIGQPNGIASLDEEGSVKLGQLNNVQYLVDFYGKYDVAFDVSNLNAKDLHERNMSFNLFDFYNEPLASYAQTFKSLGLKVLDYVTYGSSTVGYVTCQETHITLTAYHSQTSITSHVVVGSNEYYDLTDVDYIDFDFSMSGGDSTTGAAVYLGVERKLTTSFSAFSERLIYSNSSLGYGVRSLDVRHLEGKYYLKLASRRGPNSSSTWTHLNLRGVSFRGANLVANPLSTVEYIQGNSIGMTSSSTSQILDLGYWKAPQGFLDWISFNAFVTKPERTNISFNIYDEHNNLIKENIENGEIFRNFTNPIIKIEVTMSRDDPDLLSPRIYWISIGARGIKEFKDWTPISKEKLLSTAYQIDIELPSVYSEFKVVGRNIRGNTTTGTVELLMRFNDDNSNIYQRTITNNTTTSSTTGAFISLGTGVVGNTANRGIFDATIQNYGDGDATLTRFYSGSINSQTYGGYGIGMWKKPDKISKITLFPSTGYFLAEPVFEIWGR